jgi:hypothetical protein
LPDHTDRDLSDLSALPAAGEPLFEEPPPGDPPIAAWERDLGRRRGARLAMTVLLDAKAGRPLDETMAAAGPALRRLTRAQLGMMSEALDEAMRLQRGA